MVAAPAPVHVAPRFAGFRSPYAVQAPYFAAVTRQLPQAPTAVVLPAVHAELDADVPAPVHPDHTKDWIAWRKTLLKSRIEQSEALGASPLFKDAFNKDLDGSKKTQADKLSKAFGQLAQQQKLQAAEYSLNVAAERGEDITDLKAAYDYSRLELISASDNINPESKKLIDYQIARQDYAADGADAAEAIAAAKTPQELADAKLDQLEVTSDFFDALNNVGSTHFAFGDKFTTYIGFKQSSKGLKTRQKSFDEKAAKFQAEQTPANYYALQIAELKLEKAEADYMSKVSGFVNPLASLLGGNYAAALTYKKKQIDAKIADLAEKLAAETYKKKHGKEPVGRVVNQPSMQKSQQVFYNYLSGVEP